MDAWKFYDITHRDDVYCNPLSTTKFEELIEILRLAERNGVSGIGVDISPFCIRDATRKAAARVPRADLTFLEMDASRFGSGGRVFDLAMGVGASWIWHGHRGTLRALTGFVRPGGLVLAGEPYWRQTPDPSYLAADQTRADDFSTHQGNVAIGLVIASSDDDWDRYESLTWQAAERFAAEYPDDPDVPEVLARVRAARDIYLRWGRDTMGWALYLFRR